MPIIRRIKCINTTAGVCRLVCTCSCTPNGHLYRVTYTRCRIDTINSPDDEHMAARNMKRIEINIHDKELCVKLVIYKDETVQFNCEKTARKTELNVLRHSTDFPSGLSGFCQFCVSSRVCYYGG